jgi:hypothetical protein
LSWVRVLFKGETMKNCPICLANGKETLIREEDLVCSGCRFLKGINNYLEVEK